MSAIEEVCTSFVRVSTAASILGFDAPKVYRELFTNRLRGISIDGVRFVELASVREHPQYQEKRASTAAA